MAERRSGGGQGAARLALIVALLALAVAWASYRRQGGELRTLWRDLTRGGAVAKRTSSAVERQSGLAWAQARLQRRRAEVAADRNLRQVREEVAEVRSGLERAYRDAGAGARARWRELDRDLERLEGQLREGGSQALAALDSALARIRRETRKEADDRRP